LKRKACHEFNPKSEIRNPKLSARCFPITVLICVHLWFSFMLLVASCFVKFVEFVAKFFSWCDDRRKQAVNAT